MYRGVTRVAPARLNDTSSIHYARPNSVSQKLAQWGRGRPTLPRERGRIHTGRLGDLPGDDEVRAAAGPLLELARAWAERVRHGHLMALCQSLGARLSLVTGLLDLLEEQHGTGR